ncbi:MAG: hydrolase [Bdellovibrionales bacterium GWA2_49_15]|nr:MAG: hydrolase [Bdellovibrionales bacterium GWA2_49_15]HAZ14114.1 hydrolase [Bdellovibrionales bacterium]
MDLLAWEKIFEQKISHLALGDDPAHDLLHFKRVVHLAKDLCQREGGKPEIVIPAAWLHDFVIVPKDSPLRAKASRLAAEKAREFLESIHFPKEHLAEIAHAIMAHSFSANIEAKTLEAKIVQDADRLDGLGAIGIARCFATAGLIKRPFYAPEDPFCEKRPPDDSQFTVDHFYKKLFKTAETLKTPSGLAEGRRRAEMMRQYLAALKLEIIS